MVKHVSMWLQLIFAVGNACINFDKVMVFAVGYGICSGLWHGKVMVFATCKTILRNYFHVKSFGEKIKYCTTSYVK